MSEPSTGRVPEIAYEAPAAPVDRASLLERRLAPILTELEQVRGEARAQIFSRLVLFLPLGVAGGFLFAFFDQKGEATNVGSMLFHMGMGAVFGWFLATGPISSRYRMNYKNRVLPVLAADFGDFTYREAQYPDFERLRREGILPNHSRVACEDEIVGRLRGHAVSIVEAKLSIRSGKRTREVFRGLIATIELPRSVNGTIAIVPDGGSIGNFADSFMRRGSERIALEDPRFEAVYEVYGSDQVGARALLTPAFMERFLAIKDKPGFQRPLAFVEANRMVFVMPRPGQLFQPPSWRDPARDGAALVQLERDIDTVLDVVDAALDVDRSTRA